MNPQNVIDQFFIQDNIAESNGRFKRSILLALIQDFQFCVLLHGRWKHLNLSAEQKAERQKIMPSFAIISLFCSGVDLLARVTNKSRPARGHNGNFFKDCAINWFGINSTEADQLWMLRNSISHSYSLNTRQIVIQFGNSSLIRQNANGYWEFYLHAMYVSLDKAKRDIYEHLSNETVIEKNRTMLYLKGHGFIYTS